MEEQKHRPGISCLIARVGPFGVPLVCPGPPGRRSGSPSPADEGSGVLSAEPARVSAVSAVWILVLARTEWVRPPDRPTQPAFHLSQQNSRFFSRPTDAAIMWGPFDARFLEENQCVLSENWVIWSKRVRWYPNGDMLNCTLGAECILHEHNNPHNHHHPPHALHQSAVVVGTEASCECYVLLFASFFPFKLYLFSLSGLHSSVALVGNQ